MLIWLLFVYERSPDRFIRHYSVFKIYSFSGSNRRIIRKQWRATGWHNGFVVTHPNEINNLVPKSSGWLSYSKYLIRMTYGRCIMSSGWHSWCWYLIWMSYGKSIVSCRWHTLPSYVIRWLNWGWYPIQMSYSNVIMSSRWDTLPFLSHPDEIANFDFPQHAVALSASVVRSISSLSWVSVRVHKALTLWVHLDCDKMTVLFQTTF